MSEEFTYVQVLYDFEYEADDGKRVTMKEGEKFILLNKTNNDWWQVTRDADLKAFYAPASYMEENRALTADSMQKFEGENNNKKICSSMMPCDNMSTVLDNNHSDNENEEVDDDDNCSEFESETPKIHQGLLFNNPLYGEDECFENKSYSEPEIDYSNDSDEEVSDDEVQKDMNDLNKLDSSPKESNLSESVPVKKHCFAEIDQSKQDEKLKHSPSENRVYVNLPLNSSPMPPSPSGTECPIRILLNYWAEYEDLNGRKYYFNSKTHEKSWKPPRRRSEKMSSCSSTDSNSWLNDRSEASQRPTFENNSLLLPNGWSQSYDEDSGEICFTNNITKERWFTSTDAQGRIYYYQENASESFWQLPEVIVKETENVGKNDSASLSSPNSPTDLVFSPPVSPVLSPQCRRVSSQPRPSSVADNRLKSQSMVLTDVNVYRSSTLPRSYSGQYWSIQQAGQQLFVRQGILNKTKLMEGGKKVRKSWSLSHVVLNERHLLFFKDVKSAQLKQAFVGNKHELCVDLSGARVEWTPEKSSRKHVFQLSTVNGMQLLLQEDSSQSSEDWFDAIRSAIDRLSSNSILDSVITDLGCEGSGEISPDETKKIFKLNRSRFKNSGSSEELDYSSAERKMKIKDKLLNFFLRRPTIESLREKGIIKEEPVFGCNLQNLCFREKMPVPRFVQKCITIIEKTDLKADGLYRASGNLSQVQKIRFQVNQENMACLEEEEDVHVLTGALKMFFRELKEPLIPFKTFEKFLTFIMLPDRTTKLHRFSESVSNLPRPNYNTLKYLLQHLLRVTEYSEHNRMHIHNLAIVYGPTLMWTEVESTNLALDMMTQNQIIEFLLLEFNYIFR